MTDKRSWSRDGRMVVRAAPSSSTTSFLRVGPRHLVSAVREGQPRKSILEKTDGCGDADWLIAEIARETR